MATLTKSTGTAVLSGAAEKVTLPASYGWVWVKNMSEGDIFAGLSADISEGADGVLTIPSGECGRVQTDGFSSVYLLGTGNALVVAQNYADCPFKGGAKGGESPDLSVYAKTADVPNIKVNEAVNADTVGGIRPEEISTTPIKSTGWITTPTNEYGKIVLPNSDSRGYISVTVAGCYNQMYMDNDNYVFYVTDGIFNPQVNTAISYIAYYIE